MGESIILIGASVRAAAVSAHNAGLQPWCIDLFADRDLQALAPSQRCPLADYPAGIVALLQSLPLAPVVYTGGLENHVTLIETIAATRPIWGNRAESLHRSRSPWFLANLLQTAGFPSLSILPPEQVPNRVETARFVRKPLRGAGGMGIRFATEDDRPDAAYYFQQFLGGQPISAAYCAMPEKTRLLGATEQLIGESWLHAGEFRYCGSIGPIPLTSELESRLTRLGEVIAAGCGLRGLFGIDFILEDETPWLLEANPRYCASMELLERAGFGNSMGWQRAAFTAGGPPTLAPNHRFFGKAVVHAGQAIQFPERGVWDDGFCADLPHPGDQIETGWPVLTVFAEGTDRADCLQKLRTQTTQVLRATETNP